MQHLRAGPAVYRSYDQCNVIVVHVLLHVKKQQHCHDEALKEYEAHSIELKELETMRLM